jgi:flagellar FliJ protein
MKRFKFRLERVLEYRLTVKQERLRDLITARQDLEAAQDELSRLHQEQLLQRVKDGQTYLVPELVAVAAYDARLRKEIEAQHEVVAKAQKVFDQRSAEYVTASQEAEALVKLKERKHHEYNEVLAKEDERSLDELAVTRYKRTPAE